jgi:hypothetical protein
VKSKMNPQNSLTIEQIKASHPMPWSTIVGHTPQGVGGQVFVVDSGRNEVPLFVMTRLLELTTAHLANSDAKGA